MQFLTHIRDALWGMPTVVLLSLSGLYFTYRAGFFNPLKLFKALASPFLSLKSSNGGGISSLAALSTALGGTVGVGSISGVALSIAVGGAGSIFWMWVCSFLAIGLKYGEVALAHSRRVYTERGYAGGAMYCLKAMGKPRLAALFALLTVGMASCGGSMVQAEAISTALMGVFNSRALAALCVGTASLLVVSGGKRWITRFNTLALPAVSLLFTAMLLLVIVRNIEALPSAFADIFGQAFGLRQAAGGIGGAVMLRVGCTRGTFSHEAGMGSSPLSYSASAETNSHIQGLWGVTEVFIDSFVVSTLVALSLLCMGVDSVDAVFSLSFGAFGSVFYPVSVGVFAFAAVVSWGFYGEEALYYLCPGSKKAVALFRLSLAFFAFTGAMMSRQGAFAGADIWGALMLFPNLYLLFKSRSDIIALAKQNG